MAKFIPLAFLLFLTASTVLAQQPATAALSQHVKTESFEGVIFPASAAYGAEKGLTPYDLGVTEIADAERIAKAYLVDYLNTTPDDKVHQYNRFAVGVILGDLPRYRRQYYGLQDENGQKIVCIHYFFYKEGNDFFSYWQERLVAVSDGGPAFFNLRVNLTTKQVIDFKVHGMA